VTGAAHSKWRPVLGMALAASLVLGVALGVFLATRPDPVQAVVADDRSARDRAPHVQQREAAESRHIEPRHCPRNVELVGFSGRRELSWQTDLREGGNLMTASLGRARSNEGRISWQTSRTADAAKCFA